MLGLAVISAPYLHPGPFWRFLGAFSCSGKIMKINGIDGRDERIRTSDPLNPIQGQGKTLWPFLYADFRV